MTENIEETFCHLVASKTLLYYHYEFSYQQCLLVFTGDQVTESLLNIPALSSVVFIIIIIIMNFHNSKICYRLSDTPLSILDIFSNAIIWMVLTLFIFSSSSSIFTWHFGTVPKTPITTGMTVIFILIIIYLFCLFVCITVKMYCRSKCSIFKILALSELESVKLFH